MMNETIYFAGGCFWGMEALLRQIPGVISTSVGYSGGQIDHVTYEQICTGETGHTETVKVEFDPQQLSLSHLYQFQNWPSHGDAVKFPDGKHSSPFT